MGPGTCTSLIDPHCALSLETFNLNLLNEVTAVFGVAL